MDTNDPDFAKKHFYSDANSHIGIELAFTIPGTKHFIGISLRQQKRDRSNAVGYYIATFRRLYRRQSFYFHDDVVASYYLLYFTVVGIIQA